MRSNMANAVFISISLGINDLLHFYFMDALPADAFTLELELLFGLGGFNDCSKSTKLRRKRHRKRKEEN